MIESRLLELIEYRMGKTHNNVALAREILAEVSRPESGSVGSVPSVEEIEAAMVAKANEHPADSTPWRVLAHTVHALLSTAHRGEVGTITTSEHDQAVYFKGFRDGQYTQSKEAPVQPREVVSREAMEDFCQLAEIITEKRDGSGKYQRIVMNAMMMLYEKGYLNKRNQLVIRQLVSPAPGVAEAVEALRPFISHQKNCPIVRYGHLPLKDLKCECGLDRALSSLGVKP